MNTAPFQFREAVILEEGRDDRPPRVLRIEDPVEVERLWATFFGAGSPKQSDMIGLWEIAYTIIFVREDGTKLEVYLDDELEEWTDRVHGSQRLPRGFREYFRTLWGD